MSAKSKINLNRIEMPKQPPEKSAGTTSRRLPQATARARRQKKPARCLQCKKPKCVEGCPVGVEIPDFILALRDGDMPAAVAALKRKNSLPGICGRVCPQEVQCESHCVLAKKGAPVAIGRLERYVADWDLAQEKCRSLRGCAAHGQASRCRRLGPGRPDLWPRIWPGAAMRSSSSRRCMMAEAFWSTASPSFRLPKASSRRRSSTCNRWAPI